MTKRDKRSIKNKKPYDHTALRLKLKPDMIRFFIIIFFIILISLNTVYSQIAAADTTNTYEVMQGSQDLITHIL